MTRATAALIGGGFMGAVHARALRACGVPIAGVAASTPERAQIAAERIGLARGYSSVTELLADERVTLVHVLTPNRSHADFVRAALAAGKDVVCEKPLAVSAAEAAALERLAASTGRLGFVPFVYRFHPMVRFARERAASGSLGRVLSVGGAYLQDWLLYASDSNWRVDPELGGVSRAFADIGSHLCDLLEFVTGERIVRLSAQLSIAHPERAGHSVRTEDIVGVLAQLSGGGIASLLVSQTAAGRKNALVLEIHGSEESVRFEQERPEELWVGRRQGSQLLLRNPEELSGDAARLSVLPAGHPLGYQDAFTAFIADAAAASEFRRVPNGMPQFADGVRAAELTEAVIAAATRGEWIDLNSNRQQEREQSS